MTVEVTQAARDAAAEWMVDGEGLIEAYRERIKSGAWDAEQIVQAFAKAIVAETERCARIAETCEIKGPLAVGWADGASAASRQITAAIRNPVPKGQSDEG